jgi:hypothetical protein
VVNGAIRRLARIDVELAEKASERDSGALVTDADPDGAVFIMRAHGNHCPLEPRVGHPRHRQQQLAGQETRLIRHEFDHGTPPRVEQYGPAQLTAAKPSPGGERANVGKT